jgi:hypothetical protein
VDVSSSSSGDSDEASSSSLLSIEDFTPDTCSLLRSHFVASTFDEGPYSEVDNLPPTTAPSQAPACEFDTTNARGSYTTTKTPCTFQFHNAGADAIEMDFIQYHTSDLCTVENTIGASLVSSSSSSRSTSTSSSSSGSTRGAAIMTTETNSSAATTSFSTSYTSSSIMSVKEYVTNWPDECVSDFPRCYSLNYHSKLIWEFLCAKEWTVPKGTTHISVDCTVDKQQVREAELREQVELAQQEQDAIRALYQQQLVHWIIVFGSCLVGVWVVSQLLVQPLTKAVTTTSTLPSSSSNHHENQHLNPCTRMVCTRRSTSSMSNSSMSSSNSGVGGEQVQHLPCHCDACYCCIAPPTMDELSIVSSSSPNLEEESFQHLLVDHHASLPFYPCRFYVQERHRPPGRHHPPPPCYSRQHSHQSSQGSTTMTSSSTSTESTMSNSRYEDEDAAYLSAPSRQEFYDDNTEESTARTVVTQQQPVRLEHSTSAAAASSESMVPPDEEHQRPPRSLLPHQQQHPVPCDIHYHQGLRQVLHHPHHHHQQPSTTPEEDDFECQIPADFDAIPLLNHNHDCDDTIAREKESTDINSMFQEDDSNVPIVVATPYVDDNTMMSISTVMANHSHLFPPPLQAQDVIACPHSG